MAQPENRRHRDCQSQRREEKDGSGFGLDGFIAGGARRSGFAYGRVGRGAGWYMIASTGLLMVALSQFTISPCLRRQGDWTAVRLEREAVIREALAWLG
jgi:hypothetical protein